MWTVKDILVPFIQASAAERWLMMDDPEEVLGFCSLPYSIALPSLLPSRFPRVRPSRGENQIGFLLALADFSDRMGAGSRR